MPSSDFLSHLEELRRRLIFFLTVFGLAFIVCLFFTHPLLDFLTFPLRQFDRAELYFQKPVEAFLIHLTVAGLAAFFLSSPIFFWQLWLFIAPGLYSREKKFILQLVGSCALLFFVGAAFGYYLVIPWGLHFLLSFQTQTVRPLLNVGSYFSFLSGMVLAFGILFDFPIVILGLVRLGILQTRTLANSRRAVIVLIFIAAAVLTPSPDPFCQILLAIPLMVLFEITLVLARIVEKN